MTPAQASNKPVISYGPSRGRAEPIRLILEELGIEYRERRVGSWQEWMALKPQMPFQQLPAYEDGDLFIVQSHAIYRYLARTHDLYGHTEAERIDCDIVEEALRDARQEFWRFLKGLLPEKDRGLFAAGRLTTTLDCLEKYFRRHSADTKFWGGDALTFVDLLAFAYLDDVRALFPETLPKFGKLRDFRDRIAARPRLADYVSSDRRPAAILFGPDGQPVIDPESRAPVPSPWTFGIE